MERVELRARSRTVLGKQVRQLRAQGWVPAVVYGRQVAPRSIVTEERPLAKALQRAGSTALIDLYIDDEPSPNAVLASQIQRNAINGHLVHVDFYQVSLTEKVKTSPHLRFVGEPLALRGGVAVLLHNMTEVEVECLPGDLISSIEVNLSSLINIGDSIYVRDLVTPAGIAVLADPNDVVASLIPTRIAKTEEEVAAEATPAEEAK
jgi:large subunit ribosomal protein L25